MIGSDIICILNIYVWSDSTRFYKHLILNKLESMNNSVHEQKE